MVARDIPDRAARSLFVVVPTPGPAAFLKQLAFERLDERIVRQFARPTEVADHAALISPQIHVPIDELAAVIHPDRLRVADLPASLIQRRDHVLSAIAKPRIDHLQDAQLATRRKLIVHKVHRPYIVRPDGRGTILAQLSIDPSLGGLVAQLQANSL
jgi:hypothetical protein